MNLSEIKKRNLDYQVCCLRAGQKIMSQRTKDVDWLIRRVKALEEVSEAVLKLSDELPCECEVHSDVVCDFCALRTLAEKARAALDGWEVENG